jgi:hypothetical protein
MYRMPGDGNWSDLMWADTYGGASNGLVPDATTTVSFTDLNAGYTTTITSAAACLTIGAGGPGPKTLVSSGGSLTIGGTSSLTPFVTTSLDVILGGSGFPNFYSGSLRSLVHTSGAWNCPDPITLSTTFSISSTTGSMEFTGGLTASAITCTTATLATVNNAVVGGTMSFTGTSAPTLGGTCSCVAFTASGTSINFGNAVISATGNVSVTATTVVPGTSTLKFTRTSGSQTFTTGGKTFATVWNAQGGTAALTFTGSGATFGTFKSNSGRTTTFTAGHTFNIAACDASGMVIRSTTTSAYTWNNTSGVQISIPNADVQYSTATGTGGFRATGTYVDSGNNTGWFFGAGGSTAADRFFLLF